MRKSLAAAIIAIVACTPGAASFAGQCPHDKMMADATMPNGTPARGVTDTVLTAINLAEEPAKIDGRTFRLRKLTIAPGGVVPEADQRLGPVADRHGQVEHDHVGRVLPGRCDHSCLA